MSKRDNRRRFLQRAVTVSIGSLSASQLVQGSVDPTITNKNDQNKATSDLRQVQQELDPTSVPNAAVNESIAGVGIDSDSSGLPSLVPPETAVTPQTLLQGDAPLQRDQTAWATVTDRLKRYYSITSANAPEFSTATSESAPSVVTNQLGLPLQQKFMPIDYRFVFQSQTGDAEFRYNHAEQLLDQVADLLLRGLRDRAEWNDLSVKAFDKAVELQEYWDLDSIHQEEVSKGFYSVAAKESHAILRSELETKLGYQVATDYIDWLLKEKFSQAELSRQSKAAQLAAFMASLSAYELPAQGRIITHTWDGVAKTIPEHMRDSALTQNWFGLVNQYVSTLVHQQTQRTILESSDRRLTGFEARADWERYDVDFRRRRTQVSRALADLKTKAFTEPGGALNYSERMAPIRDRFILDFRDALARLKAAELGLRKIYGYTVPLPTSVSQLFTEGHENTRKAFDECVLWVRGAISWMVKFTQLDQNYVLPLSIKKLTGANWSAGKQTGIWSFKIDNNTWFSEQRHVRLRGISAFAVSDKKRLWQVLVTPPRTDSKSWHLPNTEVDLDQRHAPVCRLARVASREAVRDPDVGGLASLYNLSPIGSWNLVLRQNLEDVANFNDIDDVHLDLHLAFRSAI
jgi:hypothetical protein